MLRFFKVNDPYRLPVLLVLMFLLRIPFYWNGSEMLLPDLHHMLIGERLSDGSVLYKDIWVNISPFSAAFFTVIHQLFGKSIVAYHIIGFSLMFAQAILFNRLALVNKIYTENSYLPAVIYAILMSISIDMFAVSPIMFSITFILLAMNNIFGQVAFRGKRDEKILSIGVYLAVATLFYFPAILFGLISILGLALFSATIFRRYLLILYGFALPFLLIGVYYFFMENTTDSFRMFFSSWSSRPTFKLDRTAVIILNVIPIFFLILAIFRVLQESRVSNYQARIAQLMFFWVVLSLSLLIRPVSGLSDLMIFVPPVAYFIAHFFILFRRHLLSEISFLLFICSITALSYAAFFGVDIVSEYVSYAPLAIQKRKVDNLLRGQKVWVIGDDLHLYKNSTIASKFYSWETYNELLTGVENSAYRTSLVYEDLVENVPAVIIDPHGVMSELFAKMPTVSNRYEILEKGVYVKRGLF